MDLVIDDCARTSNIHNVMLDCCNAGWQGYLDLVQVSIDTVPNTVLYYRNTNIGSEKFAF